MSVRRVSFADTSDEVTNICVGTMMFGDRCDSDLSQKIVGTALDLGINFFDTAPMYAGGVSEEYLGRALGRHRDEVFITTKVHTGVDEPAILASLDESLKRLNTDRVDLYLIHWPLQDMNLTDAVGALNKVVRSGKTRYVGFCNCPAWLLASSNAVAAEHGWSRLRCNQVAYNLIERGVEVEILPQAIAESIFVSAYRPISMGLLAGGYRERKVFDSQLRGVADSRVITWFTQHSHAIERFVQHAEAKGVHPAQLAVAWALSSPAVSSTIVGTTSPEQFAGSVKAADIELSDEERQQISDYFDTDVKEEGLQLFPGTKYNFPRLRRALFLATRE